MTSITGKRPLHRIGEHSLLSLEIARSIQPNDSFILCLPTCDCVVTSTSPTPNGLPISLPVVASTASGTPGSDLHAMTMVGKWPQSEPVGIGTTGCVRESTVPKPLDDRCGTILTQNLFQLIRAGSIERVVAHHDAVDLWQRLWPSHCSILSAKNV
jgi:hypothetical protein